MDGDGRCADVASGVAAEAARIAGREPFRSLPQERLNCLLAEWKVIFAARGAIVCHPRITERERCFWIVRQGMVRANAPGEATEAASEEAEDLVAGAVLPVESVLDGAPAERIYTAAEDSFLWRLDGGALERLLAEPMFLRWVGRQLQARHGRLQTEYLALLRSRQVADQALSLPVSSIASHALQCVAASTPIAEVAALMDRRRIGSVLVGSLVDVQGIITQSDLVRRAMALALPASTPAAVVMTPQPATIDERDSVLDAAAEMGRRGYRHLLIRGPTGAASGIVSERDLFKVQQQGLRDLHAAIEEAPLLADVVALAKRVHQLMARVFAQGMAVTPLTRLISTFNDRLTRRIIALLIDERHPDWRYCWLAFGSEGREEQGFVTDQDNGILFDGPQQGKVEEVRRDFLEAAAEVNDALDAAGFVRCRGGIMAGNPEWCLSLDEWKAKFSRWIRASTPAAILNSTIFFDFRVIAGMAEMAEHLRDHLFDELRGNSIFLHLLAKNALEVGPPLGPMNGFRTEGSEHRGSIDLKTQGTRLFVDVARIYALAFGVRSANTEQRLATVGTRINRPPSAIDADIGALRFILGLRLHRQIDSLTNGGSANRIDPYALNDLDRRMLRESLRQAQSLQSRLKLDYLR